MGRRRSGKRKAAANVSSDPVGDTDTVYDEIDEFNNEQNEVSGPLFKKSKRKQMEVLSVEVDGLDDLYEDANLDKEEEDLPNAHKWGKNRKEYYVNSKTRIHEDGVLNDEEQEALELEEEDAMDRQKKLDTRTAGVDFDQFLFDGDETNLVVKQKPTQKMTLRERLAIEAAKKKKEEETKPKTLIKMQKVAPIDSKQVKKEDKPEFVEGWDDYEDEEPKREEKPVEKRGITREISENKGLIQKRKKGTEHSRIKRRHQYKKALIKRRSQVPDVKKELNRYTGEARGIRASTVRSIKIKA